jgi:hypothetical protein
VACIGWQLSVSPRGCTPTHPQTPHPTGRRRSSAACVRATNTPPHAAPLPLQDTEKQHQQQPASQQASPSVDWLATGLCFIFPAVRRKGGVQVASLSLPLASLPDTVCCLAAVGVALPSPCLQIGGGLFGYDIGASSGVLVSMSSATLSGTDW